MNLQIGPLARIVDQRFTVTFDYQVRFTERAFDRDNPSLLQAITKVEPARRHWLTVFLDDGVSEALPDLPQMIEGYVGAHESHLRLTAAPVIIPGGEVCKNDSAILRGILHRLHQLGVDRHSFVLAIGGGAVLDTVSFAAATCHRGVRLIRMPTTVLAQNDSGIGVKTGINMFGVKNFVGAFAPPFAVINDASFLETLGERDRRAGMAEAVKVALVRDGEFFAWLEDQADNLAAFKRAAVTYMIARCARLHLDHIAGGGDPFESGSVRPLDYGHWSAHRLESLSDHNLRHGEAVAIGMALDARYAAQIGLLSRGEVERICNLLERLGFRLWHPMMKQTRAGLDSALLRGLQEFRQHLGGELTVTLVSGIGVGKEVHEIDCREMLRAVAWLEARDGAR